MILMTGATGTLGNPLLGRLLGAGEQVRCLVREPRRLGPHRVQVQIALGNLSDRHGFDRTMRGVDTVIHLAATTRDQGRGSIEEVNGLGTARLIAAARRAGVRRFVFVSSFGATSASPSRFIRSQGLAAQAIRDSGLEPVLFEAGVIYAPDDPWVTLMSRMAKLPVVPLPGNGKAKFQPIWAEDAADAITATLLRDIKTPGKPIALAGPEALSQNQMLRVIMRHFGSRKPIWHAPLGLSKRAIDLQEDWLGPAAVATWDEVALLQHSILAPHGTADLKALGVDPLPMADVLPTR
jgi:NADH dehydrogenase